MLSKENKKTNENTAKKAFQNKYDAIYNVFKNIENYQNSIFTFGQQHELLETKKQFSLLNQFNIQQNMKPYNWVSSNTNSSHWLQEITPKEGTRKKSFEPKILERSSDPRQQSILFQNNDSIFWSQFIISNPQSKAAFGYTLNLNFLHDYFSQITQSQDNYAYVFTKNGTCITHPETKLIGKNVFQFTDINAEDTLMNSKEFTERKVLSEYLNLEVTRFIKPLKTDNFDGYLAVNYVNFLIDENISKTRLYIIFIFVATFILILIIFIFFQQMTNKAYQEKEKVQSERNKLLVVNEEILKENAINQLQQLKNQMNPHFLFNSLNSLYMLIGMDASKAQKFTMNLSKIYRYLIVPPKENWVLVKTEWSFIHQYMDLQKSRFEDEIIFTAQLNHPDNFEKKIPYLSLQIGVENAIKHNVATVETPLTIHIFDNEKGIFILNSYQPKQIKPEGEQFGLKYLQKIYAFYKNDEFSFRIEDRQFIVFIPFLESN